MSDPPRAELVNSIPFVTLPVRGYRAPGVGPGGSDAPPRPVYTTAIVHRPWTGPRAEDLDAAGNILAPPLPAERWPYCWPREHQACCVLHEGGRFCDCLASDESDGDDADLELPE